MESKHWLPLFIASILGIVAYIAITRPKDDRNIWDSIEEDWWG